MKKLWLLLLIFVIPTAVYAVDELLWSQNGTTDELLLAYDLASYEWECINFTFNSSYGFGASWLQRFDIYLGTETSNDGSVWVELWDNNNAHPGTMMETGNKVGANKSVLTTALSSNAWNSFNLSARTQVNASTFYWVCMRSDYAQSSGVKWKAVLPSTYGTLASGDGVTWALYSGKGTMRIYNSSDASPAAPPAAVAASFQTGTPATGYINNTLGQNISAGCSGEGNPNIRFGTTNPPTTLVANSSGTNYTYWIINSTIVTAGGTYYYYANCSNASSTATTVRNYTYDIATPTITLNALNFIDTSNISYYSQYNPNQLKVINLTFTDERDLYAFLVNITQTNGTARFEKENQTITGKSVNYTTTFNVTTWPKNKVYKVDLWATDSHTAMAIDEYAVIADKAALEFTTEKNTQLTVAAVDKATATATYQKDRYTFDYEFQDLKASRTFDITSDKPIVARDKSQYAGHLIVGTAKGGNWIDFETENSASAPTVSRIDDYHYQVTVYYKTATASASFSSIGGLNTQHKTYSWYLGDYSQIASTSTSGAPFSIAINFTKNMTFIKDIVTSFTYNGTDYSANLTRSNDSTYIYYVANLAGFAISADSTFNYQWNVNISQWPNGVAAETFNGTHSIVNFALDNCSTATMKTADFYFRMEEYPTVAINVTMELEGTYWVTGSTELKTINYLVDTASQYYLCIYPNGSSIYSDLYIKYTAPNGFTHRYYLVNNSFTNTSQNYYLYNWNTTTGTSDMRITLRQSSDFSYYENIIARLQRFYVSENTWRTVQMDESGDYGLVFFNIREENTDYRLLYYDRSNNLLLTTSSMKFSCTSGICELTQKLTPYSASTASTTLPHTITFNNNTRVINFSWSSSTDATARAVVTRETTTGATTLCDTSATGTSGNIYCNTTGYTGVFTATLRKDGNIKATAYIDSPDTQLFNFVDKVEGAIWSFAIMLTVMGFGLFSPVGVIIAAIFGLAVIYFMGLLNAVTLTFIIIASVIGIAIGIKVRT